MIKRILLCLALLLTTQFSFGQNISHEVKAGDTLYSLSRKYNVSTQSIMDANGLTSQTIRAGQTLTIPSAGTAAQPQSTVQQSQPVRSIPVSAFAKSPSEQQVASVPSTFKVPKCKLTYITESKTTIAAVCAKFGITEEMLRTNNPHIKKSKIKKNVSICIPYTNREIEALKQKEIDAARQRAAEEEARFRAELAKNRIDNIGISLILPFELSRNEKSQEAIKMIDFYEGLLLAVDELTADGRKVSINVYDESEESMASILNKINAQPCHLIIGAKSLENIEHLKNFARERNITMAIPFSSKEDITVGYPNVYQVNSKASALYDQVYARFIEENRGSDIVFVSCPSTEDFRYIEDFQTTLARNGISSYTIPVYNLNELPSKMSPGKRTVLIPTSKGVDGFKKMVDCLDTLDASVTSRVALFGYPEWQTFSTENSNKIRKYHGSFYTTFYANLTSREVLNFTSRFKAKFKRDQYNSRPLYGLLGYDVTRFFVGGLKEYGLKFHQFQNRIKINALQNPMTFERNLSDGNGFVNRNIRIVHL